MIRGGRADVRVFAVEDTSAQVCWRALPAGTVLGAGDALAEVPEPGGVPGAADLGGLAAGRAHRLWVRRPGGRAEAVGSFATLAPPPGAELCRFATVNDVHVGERGFGVLHTIREPRRRQPGYPARCLAAALAEARAWGAQALVAKGDLTWHGRARQWDEVAALLGGAGLPVAAVLGNHDVAPRSVDGRPALAAAGVSVGPSPGQPFHLDLPGIRLVMGHSAVAGRSHGDVGPGQRAALAELAGGGGQPAFVALHHYFHRFAAPLAYPPAIAGPAGAALLDALAAANPAVVVSSGHSHRNRRRDHGPVVVTQVGATMHYPGVWAGYAVHEGGIRQVVRRVAEPSAIAWTERTGHALLGAWRPWAAGLRSSRCFTHAWPP